MQNLTVNFPQTCSCTPSKNPSNITLVKFLTMDGSMAAAIIVIALDSEESERLRKRRKWSKEWFLQRGINYGHASLLKELRIKEPEDFRNFLRMDGPSFDELLGLVEPLIRKEDTVMRASIPRPNACLSP